MKTLYIILILSGVGLICPAEAAVRNVVLVHGAFADGSGWKPVADILEHDGYTVYAVQEPETTFDAKVTTAAWSQKPSYAVVAQQDRMINPELERFMSKRAKSHAIELPGSHAILLSHSKEVAALIEQAAKAADGT